MKQKIAKALLCLVLSLTMVCTSCSKNIKALMKGAAYSKTTTITAYFKNIDGSIWMSLNNKKFKNIAPMNEINSAPSNYQIQVHFPGYGFGCSSEETAEVNRKFQANANNSSVYEICVNSKAPKVISVWFKIENYNYYMSKYELSSTSKHWVLIGPVQTYMFGSAAAPTNNLIQSIPKFKDYCFESSTREKMIRINTFSEHKGSFNGGDGKVFSIHMYKNYN